MDWNCFKHAHGPQFSDSFHKIFSEIFENETENLCGDIPVELVLSFSEAAKGCTKHLSFDADVPCDSCSVDLELYSSYVPGGPESIYDLDQKTDKYAAGYYSYQWCTKKVYKGVRDIRVTIPAVLSPKQVLGDGACFTFVDVFMDNKYDRKSLPRSAVRCLNIFN